MVVMSGTPASHRCALQPAPGCSRLRPCALPLPRPAWPAPNASPPRSIAAQLLPIPRAPPPLGCRPVPRSCVYGVKLLPDWRLLTADHGGFVRLWNCRELVGAARPTLTAHGAFAPSLDSPASALVDPLVGAGSCFLSCMGALQEADGGAEGSVHGLGATWLRRLHAPTWLTAAHGSSHPQGGPPRPVGMHSLDASLTHLAVAGRDSIVRLYSFE